MNTDIGYPEDFDPDELADIQHRLDQVEAEEQSTVVTYIEMPYSIAAELVDTARSYKDKDWTSIPHLVYYALQLAASVEQCLRDEGHLDD